MVASSLAEGGRLVAQVREDDDHLVEELIVGLHERVARDLADRTRVQRDRAAKAFRRKHGFGGTAATIPSTLGVVVSESCGVP